MTNREIAEGVMVAAANMPWHSKHSLDRKCYPTHEDTNCPECWHDLVGAITAALDAKDAGAQTLGPPVLHVHAFTVAVQWETIWNPEPWTLKGPSTVKRVTRLRCAGCAETVEVGHGG